MQLLSGRLLVALLFVALTLAYLPDVGHGFVKDDFAWIHHGRLSSVQDAVALFGASLGFYRPLVALSFGVDNALFGLWSFAYGLTNLVLLIGCVIFLYVLARELRVPTWVASAAAAVWVFNFHGINMAVLYISGRPSLLLTLFALATAWSVLRRRRLLAAVCCLAALMSKEEAVLLPVLMTLWCIPLARIRRTEVVGATVSALKQTWALYAAFGAYALLRFNAGALTPLNAPSYYRFTFDVATVARNFAEYADRSLTVFAAVALLLLAYARRVWSFDPEEQEWMAKGAVWLVVGFGLTVWLPVRSSLYAVLPSVGSALMFAAVVSMLMRSIDHVRARRAAVAGVALVFLLLPVYRARNVRYVEVADLTAMTFQAIAAELPAARSGSVIELGDDRTSRANFENAFGTLFPEAAMVYFGSRYQLWVDPPPEAAPLAGLQRPSGPVIARFELLDGSLVRTR